MNALVLFEDRKTADPAEIEKEEDGPRSPASVGAGKSGVTGEREAQTTPPPPPSSKEEGAKEHQPGHKPIFSPQAQGAFLDNLSINGNVRHACKVAGVSAQTAYRARRKSPALAQLWDAALLAARSRAEDVLANRALDVVEESVFYHGEEVATRIRYDSRLLLAYLARLDRLAERSEVSAQLTQLDEAMDALKRGEELPEISPQDTVPSVPSCRELHPSSSSGGPQVAEGVRPAENAVGETTTPSSSEAIGQEERLSAMEAARPKDALKPHQLAHNVTETGEIEALQLVAFEAGLAQWWLIIEEGQLLAALEAAEATCP